MSLIGVVTALAPEFIVLAGACAVLLLGVTPASSKAVAPIAVVTFAVALLVAVFGEPPMQAEVLPGIWINSLAVYARCFALSLGMLIVLVNWSQPIATERGEYMALILFSLLGVMLTASANDLVVLFFAVELVSVPTYVLIALSRLDVRASESSVKYFFLGAFSAAILALGTAYLYGATGATGIYSFANGVPRSFFEGVTLTAALPLVGFVLFLGGLLFKIAAVPFHVYAADVYEGAAAPVSGMLGFVPKFAGFLALIKILTAFDWSLPPAIAWTLWIVAAATMTAGNVLALLQKNIKRMLAYSSIAHTGYMLVAVLAGPVAGSGPMRDGVAAMLFYIVVYGAMNLGAFALLAAFRIGDREMETIDDVAGLSRQSPMAAFALAVCAFSLMGLPPTAGFLGKIYLFSSALSLPATHPMHEAMVALVIIAVLNTAAGAAYYLRIIAAAYVGEPAAGTSGDGRSAPTADIVPAGGAAVRLGVALCSIPLIILFLRPALLVRRAEQATVVVHETLPHPVGLTDLRQ